MADEDGLRRCPYCDSNEIDVMDLDPTGMIMPYCSCQECLACGPSGQDVEEAIELWNKRAKPDWARQQKYKLSDLLD